MGSKFHGWYVSVSYTVTGSYGEKERTTGIAVSSGENTLNVGTAERRIRDSLVRRYESLDVSHVTVLRWQEISEREFGTCPRRIRI